MTNRADSAGTAHDRKSVLIHSFLFQLFQQLPGHFRMAFLQFLHLPVIHEIPDLRPCLKNCRMGMGEHPRFHHFRGSTVRRTSVICPVISAAVFFTIFSVLRHKNKFIDRDDCRCCKPFRRSQLPDPALFHISLLSGTCPSALLSEFI